MERRRHQINLSSYKANMNWQFKYRCWIIRVIDGDSVELDIDLGFGITQRRKCRLLGIDAPERGEDGHIEAKEALENLVWLYPKIMCITHKDKPGKFGRYLVTIKSMDEIVDFNQVLLDQEVVKPYLK